MKKQGSILHRISHTVSVSSKVCKGYFTVEAALIFPIVLWIYLMLIELVIFQYDRCIQEQDIGILAFRGALMLEEEKEQVLRTLQENNIYKDKYVLFQQDAPHILLDKNRISVKGEGILMADIALTAKASYENERINPVIFIRTYRKLLD